MSATPQRVVVGLGSNVDAHRHLRGGLDELASRFGELSLSPVYEAEAIGFAGPPFLNLVAAFDAALPVGELVAELHAIERLQGHPGNLPKFSSRTLDLDLLLYGDCCGRIDGVSIPRDDIVSYAYVLWPLADLLGDACHPVLGESFAALRHRFGAGQRLQPVSFEWRGRDLSAPLLAAGAPLPR